MSSTSTTDPTAPALPDYAPASNAALARALNDQGARNKVTHLVYSHHHADHAGACSLFGKGVARIRHEGTRRLLRRDNDPTRPAPEETFQDRRTPEIGGERIELAWRGVNHTPGRARMVGADRSRPALPRLAPTAGGREDVSAGRLITLPNRGATYVRDFPGPEGAPVLLLLHGWTSTADLNWSPSFQTLSQEFRVLALDHRGHGRGIRSTDVFTLEDCADDAAALLHHLRVRRAIVVGYSMGGPIAQLLWRRHPDLVAALVLCATSDHFSERPWEAALFSLAPLGVALSRLMPRHVVGGAVRRLRRRVTVPDPMLDLAVEAVTRHDWPAVLEAASALGRFDSRSWVSQIDVPTAMVHTTNDHVVSSRRQLRLAAAIPGASIHPVDGDHDACINRPELFVPALVQACAAVAARVRQAPSAPPPGALALAA